MSTIKLLTASLIFIGIANTAMSSGSLRHILPTLASIAESNLVEAEIVYDDINKKIVLKTDTEALILLDQRDVKVEKEISMPLIVAAWTNLRIPGEDWTVDIDKGLIKINDNYYTNNTNIICTMNTSLDSSVPSSDAYITPIYLYLIPNSDNFSCALSYNSNGPTTSSTWKRVATYTRSVRGQTVSSFSKNGVTSINGLGTSNLFVNTVNTFDDQQFINILEIPSSLKSLKLSAPTCLASQTIELKSIIRHDSTTSTLSTNLSCNNATKSTVLTYDYPIQEEGTVHFTANYDGISFITVHGWTEEVIDSPKI